MDVGDLEGCAAALQVDVKTLNDLLADGWLVAEIPDSCGHSGEIPLDQTKQDIVIFGQMFEKSGAHLDPQATPYIQRCITDGSAVITSFPPVKKDIVILYNIVSIEGDVADWDKEPVM